MKNFLDMLNEEMEALNEAKMTIKQRQKVTSMGETGWTIKKKDKDKVVMTKEKKEVFVYPSGETFFPESYSSFEEQILEAIKD